MEYCRLGIDAPTSYEITLTPIDDKTMREVSRKGIDKRLYDTICEEYHGRQEDVEYDSFCFISYKDDPIIMENITRNLSLGEKYNVKPIMHPYLLEDFFYTQTNHDHHFIVGIKKNKGSHFEYDIPLSEEPIDSKQVTFGMFEDLSRVKWYGNKSKKIANGADMCLNVILVNGTLCRCVELSHQLMSEKEYVTIVDSTLTPVASFEDVDISIPTTPLQMPSLM